MMFSMLLLVPVFVPSAGRHPDRATKNRTCLSTTNEFIGGIWDGGHTLEEYLDMCRAMDDATEQLSRAEMDLARCKALQNQQAAGETSPLVQKLGMQLQGVYSHFWKLQFGEGLADLWELGREVVGIGGQILQGEGELKDVSAVQRLGKAAAGPLVSLVTGSLGLLVSGTVSTTALAVNGGLSVMRIGVGLLKLGLQMVIFLALLFYLLATESDPLASAADLLPLPDQARQRASHALTISMRGVFVASLKLSAFHALFTWLSLSASGVHLVYMSTVASAVFASLPFIPSWLVCIPAVAQLALLQDRPMAAVLLLLSHFLAWYIADTVILGEIPNSHPYFTGLAIFGGIATFDNPLQGAIVGPMALTVLSCVYQLSSGMTESSTGSRLSTPGVSGQWRQ